VGSRWETDGLLLLSTRSKVARHVSWRVGKKPHFIRVVVQNAALDLSFQKISSLPPAAQNLRVSMESLVPFGGGVCVLAVDSPRIAGTVRLRIVLNRRTRKEVHKNLSVADRIGRDADGSLPGLVFSGYVTASLVRRGWKIALARLRCSIHQFAHRSRPSQNRPRQSTTRI